MKKYFLLIVLFLFNIITWGQQIEKIWELPYRLLYIGDIDGDAVGEFANIDDETLTTTIYDGVDLNIKWTIEGIGFYDNIFMDEPESHAFPSYIKFPCIDFNSDGKKELFFVNYTDESHYAVKSILLFDVVNNTVLYEFEDPEMLYPEIAALTDVNGDGNLELVIIFGGDDSKTCVYSTGVSLTSAAVATSSNISSYKF